MYNEDLPDSEIIYQALVNKDFAYEGIFRAGVMTSGIFLPTNL